MKMTVYNIKTGEDMTVAGVDAKEFVKTGGWSYSLEKIEPEKTDKKPSTKRLQKQREDKE